MMREIDVKELQKNPFSMIGEEWMLITAEKEGKINTMTASWRCGRSVGKECGNSLYSSPEIYKGICGWFGDFYDFCSG